MDSRLDHVTLELLIQQARLAADNAFSKLSGFKVGAAILGVSGSIFTGCNVEFDNYSNTIHAEESAISAMISTGEVFPRAIAVFTNSERINFPCGMCLQSLGELGGADLVVIACTPTSHEVVHLRELLPRLFQL